MSNLEQVERELRRETISNDFALLTHCWRPISNSLAEADQAAQHLGDCE